MRRMAKVLRRFGRRLQNAKNNYYVYIIYTNPMTTASLPPVQSVVKEIKKEQIIAEYAKQTNLSIGILEMIYDICEKMDEKKLKALKKGNYKIKGKKIERPTFEAGEVIQSISVIEHDEAYWRKKHEEDLERQELQKLEAIKEIDNKELTKIEEIEE